MSSRVSRVLALSLTIVLMLISPVLAAPLPTQPIKYLALGDSLAAGMIQDGTINKGYSDFLAERFNGLGYLGSYQERYAYPGYTSEDVLSDIRNDVRKSIPGSEDVMGIQETIRQSNVISLTVGANDLLEQISVTEAAYADPGLVSSVLTEVASNVSGILIDIKTLNPQAQIYVMGYYNAFPYLSDEQQQLVVSLIESLNDILEQAAVQTGGIYVPTFDAIAANYAGYIPNPMNPHPSVQGYEVIAEQFWNAMKSSLPINRVEAAPDKSTYVSGERIAYKVKMENAANLAQMAFKVNFDPSRLRYVAYEKGGVLVNNEIPPQVISRTPGTFDVLLVSNQLRDSEGNRLSGLELVSKTEKTDLITLYFEVISKPTEFTHALQIRIESLNAYTFLNDKFKEVPVSLSQEQNISLNYNGKVSGFVSLDSSPIKEGSKVILESAVNPLDRKVITLSSTGTFEILATPGQYHVYALRDRFLSKKVPAITLTAGQRYSVPSIQLLSGDADLDDVVGLSDLTNLVEEYHHTPVTADFNLDTYVDLVDLGYLAKNYRFQGDLGSKRSEY
ncbi:GDSL-type esterase/lipase family protein [Ammoniphilus sp. 3BR4]|uniref:GDSL-type esterase/lipase family protein n=1 Tax=Ammoniphilus sp. 3BR4 TaxID=3158265 RepID=UPI0034677E6E